MRRTLLLCAVALWLPAMERAASADCAPCGGQACHEKNCCKPSCHKICRVVCEMKKVEKTVWVVECEEFCVPNPSCCHDGCCREAGCCKKPCGPPPQCGPVRCRKKLVKKTITCEVPVYKCVVVARGCGQCGDESAGEPTRADEPKQVYLPAPLPMR
ncbi:MAG: hypothetical protein JW809_19210 [Pirellulales bacterium]|nr:hypothetical protein [Pirellulales bacterium]